MNPTWLIAFIRKFSSQFECNCGCSRLLSVLRKRFCKKIRKRFVASRSESRCKLDDQFGSEESIFDIELQEIEPRYVLEVISTSVDKMADEEAKNIDDFFIKYEKIDKYDAGEFASVNFKSGENLLTSETDETILLEGISNDEMERITDFEFLDNLLTDQLLCRATEMSDFQEISSEEASLTPINFESTYCLFFNYQSEEDGSIVAKFNNETIGAITPPANFQSMENLSTNNQNVADNSLFAEEFSKEKMGRTSPVSLKSFENVFINCQRETYELNVDKSSTETTPIKKSLDENYSFPEEQKSPNTPRIRDAKHAEKPKVVGVKYSPIIYDVLNTSLTEKQKSPYKLEENNKDNEAKRQWEYEGINKDYSLIVHELVMERFGEAFEKCVQRIKSRRKLSRQSFSSDGQIKMDSEIRSTSSELYANIYFDRQADEMVNSRDSGVQDMAADMLKSNSDTGDSLEDGKETVEYDSQEFLREALGDDYQHLYESKDTFDISPPPTRSQIRSMYSTERSVGSSNISALLSNTEGSKSEGIYSLYSTIRKPARRSVFAMKKTRVVRPLFNSVSTHYDYDYTSIDKFRINPKVQEYIKEVSNLQNIIDQVSKALLFCRDKPKFFGDIPHIEAEKLLLLSSYKKEILDNEIEKDEYEELELEQRVGAVKILNLKCSTDPKKAAKKKEIRYYLCLIHTGVTVLSSHIITPEANGDVTFPPNCFEFKELASDFEIQISIYGMNIEKNEHKKNTSHSPKNSLSRSKKSIDNDPGTLTSFFQLLGKCKIGISELNQNVIKLENMPSNATITNELVVNIKSSLEIKNKIGGFLNIGTDSFMWNRRWFVLEGIHLKYWNYPSEENDMPPIGEFNLSFCTTYPVNRVNKKVCARARTFTLEVVEDTVTKKYLFSADSLVEFEEWKKHLNSVLITLRNWNKLKC